jgi:hypothetical protein
MEDYFIALPCARTSLAYNQMLKTIYFYENKIESSYEKDNDVHEESIELPNH